MKTSQLVWGSGWPEIFRESRHGDDPVRNSISIGSFCFCLCSIIFTIADNAGFDTADLVPQLCAAAYSDVKSQASFDVISRYSGVSSFHLQVLCNLIDLWILADNLHSSSQ
jgi:chaperonin GroEL (HSP60 family)